MPRDKKITKPFNYCPKDAILGIVANQKRGQMSIKQDSDDSTLKLSQREQENDATTDRMSHIVQNLNSLKKDSCTGVSQELKEELDAFKEFRDSVNTEGVQEVELLTRETQICKEVLKVPHRSEAMQTEFDKQDNSVEKRSALVAVTTLAAAVTETIYPELLILGSMMTASAAGIFCHSALASLGEERKITDLFQEHVESTNPRQEEVRHDFADMVLAGNNMTDLNVSEALSRH